MNIFLFKIGIINIEFSTIISFLLGTLMGFIILLLVYALAVVSSLKTKNYFSKTEKADLKTEEVKEMIENTKLSYKDKTLRADTPRITYCYQLSKDLAYGIAVRFFPSSKHPFLELSINELTLLTNYITDRVNDLLNHRGVRILRKLKVSTIVNITTKKKEIEESKAYQTASVIGENLSKFKYVLNIINPLNWGRKLIVDKVMNIVIDQICIVVISIVGEETYKIYSKKVFNKEVEIDTGTEEFIENMSSAIKDAALELDSNMSFSDSQNRLKSKIMKGSKKHLEYKTFDSLEPLRKKYEENTYEKEISSEN